MNSPRRGEPALYCSVVSRRRISAFYWTSSAIIDRTKSKTTRSTAIQFSSHDRHSSHPTGPLLARSECCPRLCQTFTNTDGEAHILKKSTSSCTTLPSQPQLPHHPFQLKTSSHPTMPPRTPLSTATSPIRLQSVSKLKIKRPNTTETSPCMGPMSAMLTCWASTASAASAGNTSSLNCAALEQALRECMDFSRKTPSKKSTINYHLQRLYPNVAGPRKRRGSLG